MKNKAVVGENLKKHIAKLEMLCERELLQQPLFEKTYLDSKLDKGIEKERVVSALGVLARYYIKKANLLWLRDRDIEGFKENNFIAAVFKRIGYQIDPLFCNYADELLPVLLSNHADSIHWFKQHFIPVLGGLEFDQSVAGISQKRYGLLHLLWMLGLQGDFDALSQVAEHGLASKYPPKKVFFTDYSFFGALAEGDVKKMEQCIDEIIKQNRFRLDIAPAFSMYSAAYGVLYAKIASIHGLQLTVSDSWIPNEWLDNDPPANCMLPELIRGDFDVFANLPYPESSEIGSFLQRHRSLSPRSPDFEMVTFKDFF